MSKVMAALLVALFPIPTLAANNDSLPRNYWHCMDGYRYQYSDNCLVTWDVKSAVFVVPESCSLAIGGRLNSDAIKSIEYAKANSTAKNFYEYYGALERKPEVLGQELKPTATYTHEQVKAHAKDLWRRACLDAKELKPARSNELIASYPIIDPTHALRLLSNARQTAIGLGGMVNCAEQGHYVVEMYASDIDIRAKNK